MFVIWATLNLLAHNDDDFWEATTAKRMKNRPIVSATKNVAQWV